MSQIFGVHCINGLPAHSYSDDILNQTSSVYITSDPAGARIFIDNIIQTGFSTPAMITDIPFGHHDFKLTFPGYTDVESSVSLDPGKTYNIFLTMGKLMTMSLSNSSLVIIFSLIAGGIVLYALTRRK